MRQIDEAVRIADSKRRARMSNWKIVNLNKKEEYSRCLVPGSTDPPLSEEEEKREKELSEKIQRLAKTRKANQVDPKNPAPKKARTERVTDEKSCLPNARTNDEAEAAKLKKQ